MSEDIYEPNMGCGSDEMKWICKAHASEIGTRSHFNSEAYGLTENEILGALIRRISSSTLRSYCAVSE